MQELAPAKRFNFLIGRWRCTANVISPEGERQTFEAKWAGRSILDGHVIADEYRMFDAAGATVVLGVNLRAFDAVKQVWNIKWLDALVGTWTDLGPEELGGVRFDGASIVYAFKEPMVGHAFTRATYTNISDTHFTWRGEGSDDGVTWSDFMTIEADRDEP